MFGVTTSDDYRPVAWMGRFPVDVTTILVGVHVALAIVTCLLIAAGGGGLLDLMMFDSARVLGSGQVWRLATYAFIHSPMQLLWFAIEMYMLFVFGREVKDFRNVDYEAISMLNVSATQELARQLLAARAELAEAQSDKRALTAEPTRPEPMTLTMSIT